MIDLSNSEKWSPELFKQYMDDERHKFDAACNILKGLQSDYPFQLPHLTDNGVTIWGHCSIHPKVKIGEGSIIGFGVNITGPIVIGENVRIQSNVFIPEGVTIEDFVFIGPGVIFTNKKYPKVRLREPKNYSRTIVKKGASIGAGSVIGSDIIIGERALIGMRSLVLKDVRSNWIARGSPAQHIREYIKHETLRSQ